MVRGTIDGKVRIVRLVGKGGMGAVYEAQDLRSGQRVAVKLMHQRIVDESEGDDGEHVDRFGREVRAAAAIDSEHVAKVLDWGTDPDRNAPYMVMEYLEGEDLHALLKRTGALRPDVALRVLAQACLGLAKAHEARIIHRDIKPANLFLARTGDGGVVVKILDFGIAKIRPERDGGETTGLTRTGGMLGSPIYMSPEQARGLRAIDYRTDIWSLGVVLYRALSGHTPHDEGEGLGDLIVSICSNVPRPIQELAPWVPAPAAAVAHGALQIHPGDRWPSAAAMLDAIRALLPEGWALRREMLVPVDDTIRSVIAPRLPELLGTSVTASGRREASAASIPPPPPPAPPVLLPEGTPVPASTAAGPRRSRWPARVAGMAALASLGAAAGAVYVGATFARRTGASLPEAPALTPSADRPSAPASPRVPGAARRHVSLAVSPKDVTVTVDDAGAAVHDGAVDIEGEAGSVHRVRASKGAAEVVADVTVTDGGAEPPRLDLRVPQTPPVIATPPETPRPPGPRAGAPSAAHSARGPTKPLIPDRFE